MNELMNGTFTVINVNTYEHRTFRIKTQPEDSSFAPGKRVVSLMCSSDNEHGYRGFGFVDDRGHVNVWNRNRTSAFEHYARMVELASRSLGGSATGDLFNGAFSYGGREYAVQHSRRCLRCNRRLTTPESINRGVGPECAHALSLAS